MLAGVQLVVDASNVPSKYILTILSECATFPLRLIFFVKGSFGVSLPLHLSTSVVICGLVYMLQAVIWSCIGCAAISPQWRGVHTKAGCINVFLVAFCDCHMSNSVPVTDKFGSRANIPQ